MSRNKIIPYNPKLKEYARQLRKNSTLAEVLLWQKIQKRVFGVQFHRQVPLLNYIVDFYCHELQLAIEIDGNTHDFKYEYDEKRQGELEKKGVRFLRFSDEEVKQNMFSVALSVEETVEGLLKNTSPLPSKKEIKHSGSVVKQGIRNINDKGFGEKHPPYPPLKGGIPKAESEGSNQELSLQENNGFEQGTKSKETKKTTPLMAPPHLDKHNTQGGFKFPKQERLKSKKIIEQLFSEGKSINAFPLKLIYLKTVLPEDVPIQVAVVAPKKHFKSAVKRNRIKRLLREAYRLNKASIFNNMEAQYALVILYLGKEMPTYSKIEVGTKALLTKFLKQISHEKTG